MKRIFTKNILTGFVLLLFVLSANAQTPPANCNPTFGTCSGDRIVSVVLGAINNTPTIANCGVSNYTAMTTTLFLGQSYPITVTATTSSVPAMGMGIGVFIDYDNSGDFAQAGELVAFLTSPQTPGSPNNYTLNGNITVPVSAPAGNHRMRVIASYYYDPATQGGCFSYSNGNYHDYNVFIKEPCPAVINMVQGDTVCGTSGTAEMLATANVTDIRWYNAATGGTLLGTSMTGDPFTRNITGTTTFYVAAWNGTCESDIRTPVVATLASNPLVPTVTPNTPATVCVGDPLNLTATTTANVNLYTQNFEGTHNMVITNAAAVNSNWTLRTSDYDYRLGAYLFLFDEYIRFRSPGGVGNRFMLANGRDYSGTSNTVIATPAIATTGYSTMSLSFDHFYRYRGTPSLGARVQVSIDGGGTWTNVAQYTNTNIGTLTNVQILLDYIDRTNFAATTINLTPYVGNADFRVRFAYEGPSGELAYWAIDNIVITATSNAGNYSWTATPSATAGLPVGAGTPSTSNNIVAATPSLPGTYTYTATNRNNFGCTSSANSAVVTVTAPDADITAHGPTTFCDGDSVLLTVPAVAGQSYQWFVDGTPVTSTTNSHYAKVGGNYTCRVSLGSCQITTINPVPVTLLPTPVAVITPSGPTIFCQGGSVTLEGTPGSFTYEWLRDGVLIPGAGAADYVATTSGSYRIAVSNGTCIDTSVATVVTVNPYPVVSASAGGPTTFCQGGSVQLTGTSSIAGSTFEWFNGATSLGAPSTTATTYNATTTGNYTVTVTSNGCSASSAPPISVTVNPIPAATITYTGPTTFCNGQSLVLNAPQDPSYTYQWQDGGIDLPGETNDTYTATTSGSYTVVVTLGPCPVTSAPVAITVNPVPVVSATAGGPTTFCQGNSVTLTGSSSLGGTYQWYNGATPVGINAATYVATTTGNYTMTATLNGCTGTSNAIPVTVNPTPTSTITTSGTTNLCQGQTVTLTAPAGYGYQWQSYGTDIPGATAQTLVVSTPGSYRVITTLGNCHDTTATPVVVNVTPIPVVNVFYNGPTTFCDGGSLTFTASGATTYIWYNGAAPAAGVNNQPTYTATTTGNYYVVGTTSGCSANSAPIAVTVNPNPIANITASGALSFCQGGSVTLSNNPAAGTYIYQWQSSGIDISGANGATYTANASGNYRVVTRLGSCYDTSNVLNVQVNPVPTSTITALGPVTFCQGSSVTLQGNDVGQWTLDNANIGAPSSTIVATASGQYRLVVSNGACQATSAPILVTVNPYPVASISPVDTQIICVGDLVTLSSNVGPNFTYQWLIDGNNIPGANAQSYTLSNGGEYSVVVGLNGCLDTSRVVVINTYPAPISVATPSGPTMFCHGESVILQVGTDPNYTYQWKKDGAEILGARNPSYLANTSGAYTVDVKLGICTVTSAPVNVTAIPLPNVTIAYIQPDLVATAGFSNYTWYWNYNSLIGNHTNIHTPEFDGSYTVLVSDEYGCKSVSAPYRVSNVGTLGVGTVELDAISIYPNPTKDMVKIDAPVEVTVSVLTIDGKLLAEHKATKGFSIASYANGVYMIRVTNKDGKLLKVARLIKE